MPYPDNFSTTLYDAGPGGMYRPEPPLIVADADDIRAMEAVCAASAVFLDALKRNPWTFDSTETVSWSDHVAEHVAIDNALAAALAEARRSREVV